MLLGRLDVSQLHVGEGEAVHSLWVLGIDLERAAQIVESPQAVAFLAEDGAQVLEGHGIPGIGRQSLHGVLFGSQKVARPIAWRQLSAHEWTTQHKTTSGPRHVVEERYVNVRGLVALSS